MSSISIASEVTVIALIESKSLGLIKAISIDLKAGN